MDQGRFDDLTRSLGRDSGTRRALLRVLAGGALGAVARLGVAALAEAKLPKNKDKDKGQGKGQGPKGQRCGQRCEDRGGRCCHDGSCAERGSCCPGEKRCGGGCIAQTSCCPHTEKSCPGGRCVDKDACCPNQEPCGDICIRKKDCCFETHRVCSDGSCIAKDRCCKDERRCEDGGCQLDRPHFCCPEEQECEDGTCVKPGECCPDDPAPVCDHCHEVVCDNGTWACRPVDPPACPPGRRFDCATGKCQCFTGRKDCGDGICCPVGDGTYVCHEGKCCAFFPPGKYVCF